MTRALEPAQLDLDDDGTPRCARHGDVYASRAGALAQARHVFIGGCEVQAHWAGQSQFVVLETGFGLGINFLATWQAWRDDPARPRRLHFVSIERYPVAAADLIAFAPVELAPLARELATRWPLPLPGLHRVCFDHGRVLLTLALGDVAELLPQLPLGADAIFLDGFAPARNAAMWSPAVFKGVARAARTDARLATWSAARIVRDGLLEVGFEIERRPGLPPKREMLVARFAPRWRVRRHEPPAVYRGQRRVIVVGAGLAGCTAASAFAERGWEVELLDARTGPASGASGLPWGLLHPQLARDDNRLARLTRAGLFASRALLERVAADDRSVWRDEGVFQLETPDWRARLAALPERYARWYEPQDAPLSQGPRPARGGVWFALGAAVSPAAWCRALLDAAGDRIRCRWGQRVQDLVPHAEGWRVITAGGERIEAPQLVIAVAGDAAPLLRLRYAPQRDVRGRVSLIEAPAVAQLQGALAGDGYLLGIGGGHAWVGASYELALPGEPGELPVERAHEGNLARLQRLLAQPMGARVIGVFEGVRNVARDRLPLAGAVADEDAALSDAGLRGAHLPALPRRAGLWMASALGSRGITLAPLLAEAIACQVEGEPAPLEQDLLAAVDPARFLLARLRRGA